MSSPIFDPGTGRRFGQKVLDNVLFGITIVDERNFSKKAHIGASIVNVLLSMLQIGVSLIPNSLGVVAIITPCVVSVVLSLLYFGLSFAPKKRQSERIRDNISDADQFINALMFCYNTIGYKLFQLITAAAIPVILNVTTYYTQLSKYVIIAVQMTVSPVLRQIDSTMAKYMPVNGLEPGLTNIVYVSGLCAVAYTHPTASLVCLAIYPVLITFGLVPQLVCLFFMVFDRVCKLFLLPTNSGEAVMFGVCLLVCYALLPFEAVIVLLILSLTFCSFCKKSVARIVIQVLAVVACIVAVVVCRVMGVSLLLVMGSVQLASESTLTYVSLALCAAFAVIYMVTMLVTQNQLHKTGTYSIVCAVFNELSYIAAAGVTVCALIQYLQNGAQLHTYMNALLTMRCLGCALFRPEALHIGGLVGLLVNFAYRDRLAGYSQIGVAVFWGSELYLILRRLIPTIIFYYHIQQLAFKVHDNGWQKSFYKARAVLWIYNTLIMLICCAVDYSILPIGGIPLLVPFYPHPRCFFVTEYNLRKYGGKTRMESQSAESVERSDDIVIYKSTSDGIFLRKQAQLRRLLLSQQLDMGEVLLLMQEKQMLFLQCLGRNIFNSSVQVIAHALETKETTCHTLERTCLERYYEYISGSKKTQKEGQCQQQLLSSTQMFEDTRVDSGYRPASHTRSPVPVRRRAPITLGQHRATQNYTNGIRNISLVENRLPKNVPQLSTSWLQKYHGAITFDNFDTSEFALSGMFNGKAVLDAISELYIKLLYAYLQSDAGILEKTRLNGSDEQNYQIEQVLRSFVSVPNQQVTRVIAKVCQMQQYQCSNMQSESDIYKNYSECATKVAGQQLRAVVKKAFRTAIWAATQAISMGDDIPQNTNEIMELIQEAAKVYIGLPSEAEWGETLRKQTYDKMFAVRPGPRAIQYTYRKLDWHVFKLPEYYYQLVWASVQADLLVFNSSDDERFSVQSLPACCRNILCEAATAPYGYPLINYGEACV